MQVTWEADDIQKYLGTVVAATPTSEKYLLGYHGGMGADEARYRLMSLDDGMIDYAYTAQQMADHLNFTKKMPLVLLEPATRLSKKLD